MIYERLKSELRKICEQHNWLREKIEVTARALTAEESIGRPSHDDYPLLKGKESMVEAVFLGARGHAFTDMPGNFAGTVEDVISLLTENNFERCIFISTLNAVLRRAGMIEKTVHCRDDEPVECAEKLAEHIAKEFGRPKIFQVGLQPRMAEKLSEQFELRIVDLDKDNVGKKAGNASVQSEDKTAENINWCDLVLATGTTIVNDTAQQFIDSGKPVIFYGVTSAGAAHILDLPRFCYCAK